MNIEFKKFNNNNKEDIEQLITLGNILKYINNSKTIEQLNNIVLSLKTNKVEDLKLSSLNVFEYDNIKNDYHNVKDFLLTVYDLFNLNKFDLINLIRLNNGLGLDRTNLDIKLEDLQKNKINNGIFNLLNDNNLIYNSIGLRILITNKLLKEDNLNNYRLIKLDSSKLDKDYRQLVYKNNKIKNYSKLYLINDNIFLSTLLHDNILIQYYGNKDINNFYGSTIETKEDIKHLETKNKKYVSINETKEEKKLNLIIDLLKFLSNTDKDYQTINKQKIEDIDFYLEDIDFYLSIIDNTKNIKNFYRYEKIYNKYLDLIKILKEEDRFKSNSLELNQTTKNGLYMNKINITSLISEYEYSDITKDIKINVKTKNKYKYGFKLDIINKYFAKHNKNFKSYYDLTKEDLKYIMNRL